MGQEQGFTYAASGVDYGPLDRFKRVCQRAARDTAACLGAHGLSEPAGIRGESAYLVETADGFLAHVEEGLGTKNLVADALFPRAHPAAYRNIGIDTVAAIVNDLITVGALPVAVAMHAAVGDSGWFGRDGRGEELAAGFAHGCRLAGAAWGGGESPVLKGVVEPGAAVLAGSALGLIRPKRHRIKGDVRDGDAIVLLASSGVHANGVTLCRALAGRLPDGYQTPLGDGRSFGAGLLEPTVIYVPFVRACQAAGVVPHYAVHVTGHGWRKLMRLEEPFVYRVTEPPAPSALYQFLLREGRLSPREAYATWNMGAGFAVYVEPGQAERCVALARDVGLGAWVAGTVVKEGERKAVEIVPPGICFEGETLEVRA
jgi:phosphoribosylformylglycinamidine cyclo-ligase